MTSVLDLDPIRRPTCAVGRSRRLETRQPHFLDHTARHEASDHHGIGFTFNHRHGPDHRSTDEVRHRDYGIVWNIDPFAAKTDAIMPALRFPVGIGYGGAIHHRAAWSIATGEMIEPTVQFGTVWIVGERGRDKNREKCS